MPTTLTKAQTTDIANQVAAKMAEIAAAPPLGHLEIQFPDDHPLSGPWNFTFNHDIIGAASATASTADLTDLGKRLSAALIAMGNQQQNEQPPFRSVGHRDFWVFADGSAFAGRWMVSINGPVPPIPTHDDVPAESEA